MATPRLPVFRWHARNRFRLLGNGDLFFPAMLQAINAAADSVLLELYLFESGDTANRFIHALASAAQRGVQVRVMIDAFGSLALAGSDRARLRQAGVALRVFNPIRLPGERSRNLARDHRKLLVVDDQVAFVGGAGITDDFSPASRPDAWWRETMLEIRGEVVHDWARLFAHAWHSGGRDDALRPASPPDAALPGYHQRGRVAIAHGPRVQDVTRHAVTRISRARQRVWLATPYFLPSWRLRRTLVAAARRGVDVRLVLPGTATDHPLLRLASHHYYAPLLHAGIHIHEYRPRFIHSKTLLVDDWVSLGSCNFDRWNLRWNLEANQEVDDTAFAAEVAAMFAADIAESTAIDAAAWQGRHPLVRRLEEGLARAGGRLERWLGRR